MVDLFGTGFSRIRKGDEDFLFFENLICCSLKRRVLCVLVVSVAQNRLSMLETVFFQGLARFSSESLLFDAESRFSSKLPVFSRAEIKFLVVKSIFSC